MKQNKEERVIELVRDYFDGNIEDAIKLFLEFKGESTHVYTAEYESDEKERTQELTIDFWEGTYDYDADHIYMVSKPKVGLYSNYHVEREYQKATFGPRRILIGDVLTFNERLLKKYLNDNEGNIEIWGETLRKQAKLNKALGTYIEKYAQKKRSLLNAPLDSLVHHEVKKITKDLASIVDAYGVVDFETYSNLLELYTLREKYDKKLPSNAKQKKLEQE